MTNEMGIAMSLVSGFPALLDDGRLPWDVQDDGTGEMAHAAPSHPAEAPRAEPQAPAQIQA
jgi:hypothetical protein